MLSGAKHLEEREAAQNDAGAPIESPKKRHDCREIASSQSLLAMTEAAPYDVVATVLTLIDLR
jgi:hypothetical protein